MKFRYTATLGIVLMLGSAIWTAATVRGMGARRGAVPNRPTSVPATELAPATGETKAPDADGFIQRWLVLEPIPHSVRSNQQLVDSYVQAAIKTEYFPNQFTVIPHDGDKVTVNGTELTWHAMDTSLYNFNLYHFAQALGKQRFNVIFWAVTLIDCPQEMSGVRLAVGSNSASIWWVNGKEVIDLYGDRHFVIDDGVSKRLTLKKGRNVIRGAVMNAPGWSNMCARFIDDEGKPLRNYTIFLNDPAK